MAHVISARPDNFQALEKRLATIGDVYSAASRYWRGTGRRTCPRAVCAAEQLASLARLAHEMLVSPETGELLERAGERKPGSDEAALLRLARGEHERTSASTSPSRACGTTWSPAPGLSGPTYTPGCGTPFPASLAT
ncbi:MAG TPA: hypothetical protein VK902_11090 [Rubrobacter sp.]|nr:hypothetical protein [Rubrobacter sp.]